MKLAVNETFGPTFQGEGPTAGRNCYFLRLAGCNLACSWCDTPYSWDWKRFDVRKESIPREIWDVAADLKIHGARHVVISGGEPMLQAGSLKALVEELYGHSITWEIETSGSVYPDSGAMILLGAMDQINVSPKLAHSGNNPTEAINIRTLRRYNGFDDMVAFKFVVQTHEDFDEIHGIVDKVGIAPENVWIMPEGVTDLKILETAHRIKHAVAARGWNLTLRMQTLLWGDKRGH